MYLSVPTTISRLATNVFIHISEAHSASRWHALKRPNHTTGDTYKDSDDSEELPSQVYVSGSKAGQMYGFKVAAVAGIEYSIAKGFVFGFEMHPLAYRYDLIQICPKGFDKL